MTKFEIEEKIVAMLKTVFDPEIPVNVYDLGLIYKIDVADSGEATIDMTLTAPNCPAADFIMEDVRQKIESIDGVTSATINGKSVRNGSLYTRPMTSTESFIRSCATSP